MTHKQTTNRQFEHVRLTLQVFITPLPVLRFMERLGDPTLKTLKCAVDTMRASMLDVIHVRNVQRLAELGSSACLGHRRWHIPAPCRLRPAASCSRLRMVDCCMFTYLLLALSQLISVSRACSGGERSWQQAALASRGTFSACCWRCAAAVTLFCERVSIVAS